MPSSPVSSLVRPIRLLVALLPVLVLGACVSLSGRDPLNVSLAGIDPLPGEGLEMRFALKLRVQNPNSDPVDYDGVAVRLEVNERVLATGVSDKEGSVPRFGERVLAVPMSVSALAALRQALGLTTNDRLDRLPYVLHGKLSRGRLGSFRFVDRGTLDLTASDQQSR